MGSLSIVVVALLALFVVTVDSFGNLLATRGARAECCLGARAEKRRKFVETGLTGIGLGFVLGGGAQVANAIGEVADGNSLPDGAKQVRSLGWWWSLVSGGLGGERRRWR